MLRRLRRLLRLGRIDEALDLARQESDSSSKCLSAARALWNAGQGDEAIAIARHGLALPGPKDRLMAWLTERYLESGEARSALEMELARFEEHPSLSRYRAVAVIARQLEQWEALRHDVILSLKERHDVASLVEIYLMEGEIDAAIDMVLVEHTPEEHTVKVARAAARERPYRAIEIYKRLVERLIERGDRQHYRRAAEYARHLRDLYRALGMEREWERYKAALLTRNARRPALAEELGAL